MQLRNLNEVPLRPTAGFVQWTVADGELIAPPAKDSARIVVGYPSSDGFFCMRRCIAANILACSSAIVV